MKEIPSIVFMDVDVKGKVGDPFYLVNELYQYLEELPCFVAISSSKKLAYDVIKSNFIDYLLKPLSELEIRKCLFRFQKKNGSRTLDKICLKSYSDYRFIDLKDILYLKADNNATDFYLITEKKISAYKTLKYFEEAMPNNFLRVHHSYIINTCQIARINFAKSKIILRGNLEDIPFSKSYKAQVDHLKDNFFTSLSVVS